MDVKVRSMVQMAAVKNEREFILHVPFGAPYDDAKEVLNEFIAALDELRKQNEKAAAELAEQANKDKEAQAPIDIESEPKGE